MGEEHKQSAIFMTIVFSIIVLLAVAAVLWNQITANPVWFAVPVGAALIILFYVKSPHFFIQLQEYERAVVFHMGAFEKVSGPGWLFVIPVIESYRLVDLRTKTVDIGSQEVVTKDNIKIKLDAVLYLKVLDAKSAVLNVENYEKAASSNIQASLRATIGEMELSEVLSNMKIISIKLKENTQDVATEWGVSIDNVEIQNIELPKGLQEAMTRRKEEEQKKLAAKETAEGMKVKLDAIQESAGKFTDPTLKYMYMQSLNKMADGKATKIIFPMELTALASSISNSIGMSVNSVQKELVSKYEQKAKEGEAPSTIIDELKKEYGVETEKLKKEIKKGVSKKTPMIKKK